MSSYFKCSLYLLTSISTISMAAPVAAQSQNETLQNYAIGAGRLGPALRAAAQLAGYEIIFPAADVQNRRTNGVSGRLDVRTAIAQLLQGTGLVAEYSGRTVIVRKQSPADVSIETADETAPIIVTGSRIRGAQTSSPVLKITAKQMQQAGQNDLGEVVRALPQNFSGGQNPGIGIGAESFGSQNGNSASALNLRGLGPDATLTLLNGRRLVYDSAYQGVDISSIPVAAVERLEIMPDGASAIYGSDAVGGVANIILKRDFDGLETTARIATASDGGNFQQQYSAVGGTRWGSGGFVATLDLNRSTPITAGQRDYTAALHPSATLIPRTNYRGAVLSGYQAITDNLAFEIDALYGRRRASSETPFTSLAPATTNGNTSDTVAESFLLSPQLTLGVGKWNVVASGIYGKSRSELDTRFYTRGVQSPANLTQYDNESEVYELSGEGPLVALPAGDVRLALGGGYRAARLDSLRSGRTTSGILDSHYAYAEAFLPLISPEMAISGIHRLTVNAAARYENYPGMAKVTTPKVGLVYTPFGELDLKLSWGRSFKAPTLNQQLLAQTALLYPASLVGANGLPATASALIVAGGNKTLEPEKARTIAIGFEARPVSGWKIELNWFDVKYRNRVVQPISSLATSLSNPALADLIDLTPTLAEQDAIIASASPTFFNLTGRPYDPAQVVAIIDSRFRNVANQTVRGIDIATSYNISTGPGGSLTLSANASHIASKRRLSANQSEVVLSGMLFNPPKWRARGGIGWEQDAFSASAFISHIGPVSDARLARSVKIDGMTTIDLVSRYSVAGDGVFGGIKIGLSILNLFNEKPASIRTTQPYNTPYDSTNYSPVGRVIGVTVAKAW